MISSADTQSGQNYSSSTSDESSLLVSTSDDVTITDPTVTKSGDSDGGDNCNFYGLNAAVLVKDGTTTTITGGTITSDASGANGVFCYGGNGGQNGAEGDGTTLIIRDTKIVTTGDGSGGIMTTGGGVTQAYNLDVTTSGQSSAAIRTDRGGGTVNVVLVAFLRTGHGPPFNQFLERIVRFVVRDAAIGRHVFHDRRATRIHAGHDRLQMGGHLPWLHAAHAGVPA